MGEITDKNTKELEQAFCYGQADLTDMVDNCFAEEFDKLIMAKGYSTQYIVQNSRISKTYLNELRRRLPTGKKKHISREKLIEVCLTIDASLEEINALLKCAGYQPLYSRNRADSFIIWGLLHKMKGLEIRDQLFEQEFWIEK